MIRVSEHIILICSPLKGRIPLHNIPVEGQMVSCGDKGIRPDLQCRMSCGRFGKVNVIQPRAPCESVRPDTCHGITDPHLLQLFQVTEHTVADLRHGIVLYGDAANHFTQLLIIKTARPDTLYLDISNHLGDHQIHLTWIPRDQRTGNQSTVLTRRITVSRPVLARERHLVVLFAILHVHIRNALTVGTNRIPCAGSRERRAAGV